jgi:hypothetical protein
VCHTLAAAWSPVVDRHPVAAPRVSQRGGVEAGFPPRVVRRTLPLPSARALSVAITVGAVRIDAWDRAEAQISIEREAPDAAALTRLPIVVDETPDGVTIRAVQEGGTADAALRARVTARVPRAAQIERIAVQEGRLTIDGLRGRVTASVQRGAIEAVDVSGAIRLETVIGPITLRRARLSAGGVLRLRAFNGDVMLDLAERPADARILALALNGTIHSTIPLEARDRWGPRSGEATLGKGEPVISIDVVTGTIEIRSP